ncbi:hypothetical protein U1Q18_025049 [Sarracenia purpurea var. burkii]
MQVFMERFMGRADRYDQAHGARTQGMSSQTPVASASAAPIASVPPTQEPQQLATQAQGPAAPTPPAAQVLQAAVQTSSVAAQETAAKAPHLLPPQL